MSDRTPGQQADEEAFQAMLVSWQREHGRPRFLADEEEKAQRFAWAKAIQRGLELRGCCEKRNAGD